MKTHNVFIACDNLQQARYYADEFVKKYHHRITCVRAKKLDLTIKFDEENEARIQFMPWRYVEPCSCGYRNLRCITGEVSELVNFDCLSDILEIPVYRP